MMTFMIICIEVVVSIASLAAAALILVTIAAILETKIEDLAFEHKMRKLKLQDEKQRLERERETWEK